MTTAAMPPALAPRRAINLGPLQEKPDEEGQEKFLFSQKAASQYLDLLYRNWETIRSDAAKLQEAKKWCAYITENTPAITVRSPAYRKWPEVVRDARIILGRIAAAPGAGLQL